MLKHFSFFKLKCYRLYREDRNVTEVTYLKQYFVKKSALDNQTAYVDSMVRGMATQNSHKIDNVFENAVLDIIVLITVIFKMHQLYFLNIRSIFSFFS